MGTRSVAFSCCYCVGRHRGTRNRIALPCIGSSPVTLLPGRRSFFSAASSMVLCGVQDFRPLSPLLLCTTPEQFDVGVPAAPSRHPQCRAVAPPAPRRIACPVAFRPLDIGDATVDATPCGYLFYPPQFSTEDAPPWCTAQYCIAHGGSGVHQWDHRKKIGSPKYTLFFSSMRCVFIM